MWYSMLGSIIKHEIDQEVKEKVAQATELPVFVENGVNLIALGEFWRGAGQDADTLVAIFLGAGVGAGVIINQHLHHGLRNAAGEIGYIVPSREFLRRRYDRLGCLEELISAPALVRSAQRLAETDPHSLLHRYLAQTGDGQLDVKQVFAAARAGDAVARQVMDEAVDYLTIALISIISVLSPPVVVISGPVALEAHDLLLEPIRQQLDGLVPALPDIRIAELKEDAFLL